MGAPLGIQTELAPGPRTAACEHMHTGWPGQGAWASGQGVSHITSPLSPGTCRVLPSSSGWHGHGCQRTPLMPGVPHLPPCHLHIPLIMELIGTGAEMGQVTVSQLLLQGIQEATRSGPVWASQESQCRLWWQSSPVLGSEVSLGLGWTESGFSLGLSPSSCSPRAQGPLKTQGWESAL